VLSGFAAVFVNYTLSPEAQYPQAIHEVYAATKWVAKHGDEINIDGKNIAVVGNSAGGNMATVAAMMAKADKGPEIKLQILLWPVVDANFETVSYQQFGEQRFLTTSMMKWMFDNYMPDPDRRREIYASPLEATVDQLRGLPPALVITSENDVLRDEGEAYGRKLAEAGVPVTCTRYNGTIHDFGCLNALAEIPQTRSLLMQTAAELKKYLSKRS
jgi:acetyl esterase/lipase